MINENEKYMEHIPYTNVTIDDRFWKPKLEVNRRLSIPYQYEQCKETGRIDAFKLDWKPHQEPKPHVFWDSDVAKWIEAASFSLATHPDKELEALLDQVIELIASAQQPDGYLNVYFTVVEPAKRWTDLRDACELYCAGHMIEAGVAHYRSTGKRTLLEVVCRYADYINTIFGKEEGKKKGYCGHEEIELALFKLYEITRNESYLWLCHYFIDERGQEPNYFAGEELARGGKPGHFESFMQTMHDKQVYNQSHQPVREQDEVVGHAVRALYLYCAMTDLAVSLQDTSLKLAVERLWKHLCTKNMYITGGIGSSVHNEGFSFDYDLPNETAYCETCASVAMVFWNHRLLKMNGESKYADVMERTLYNAVLAGSSLDGRTFFYDNPLASLGQTHRKPWFDVSCCPPNIARLLASLGGYIYSKRQREIYIHLYIQGQAVISLQDEQIILSQTTNYPWNGDISLQLSLERRTQFSLNLRLPSWCRNAALNVNGEKLDLKKLLNRGYVVIEREWKDGDQIQFVLDMPVERVYAHPLVRENMGCVALQRGPIVYCLEEVDNPLQNHGISISRGAELQAYEKPLLLGGIHVISGRGEFIDSGLNNALYFFDRPERKGFEFKAIPYFLWDNRMPGQMKVWILETD